MKAEQLMDAMGLLGDDLIEEARQSRERQGKVRQISWQRWAALAACVALVVLLGMRLTAPTPTEGPVPSSGSSGDWDLVPSPGSSGDLDLPMLTIQSNGNGNIAMGFEGYFAYSADELLDNNPWTPEAELETLPVYKNTLTYSEESHKFVDIDFDEVKAVLVAVAEKLELDPDDLTITDNAPDEEYKQAVTEKLASVGETVPEGYFDPTALIAETEELRLTVDESLTAKIEFVPPTELPEEYSFYYYAASEKMAEAAAWLAEAYSGLLSDMENPTLDQGIAARNVYGERSFDVEYYDASGTLEDQIINYNFDRVAFYPNDDGDLFLARVYRMAPAEKLGDYPIISVEDARELLLAGNYITTVPYEMPGEEAIRKVELIYRTSSHEKTYLPYYRFLVELPEEEFKSGVEGLKNFGAYYVPAVEGKYIADMPMWNGEFNY